MKPDIKAIEARAAAATPGPWEASKDGWTAWAGNVKIADYLDPDNAEFIAHARTDIPRLLDYIKELEAENKILRESADNKCDNCACELLSRAEAAEAAQEGEK